MFTPRPNVTSSLALPEDALIEALSYLTVSDLPSISRTSRIWATTAKIDIVLKRTVLNSISIANTEEIPAENFNWKKLYSLNKDRSKRQIALEAERKTIERDEKDINESRAFAQTAIRQGIHPGYGIVRADTVMAGFAGASGGTAVCFFASLLACKEATCLYSVIGCFTGCLSGFWGKTSQIENRARLFRVEEKELNESLRTPLIELVEEPQPSPR